MTAGLDHETVRRLRLAHQQLVAPTLTDPAAVVTRLVAMQAQEYAMAKWAIGLRLAGGGSDADVEAACDDGRILRLHALRPTWHFVAAEDLRMVLQVTAQRVHQANAFVYRSYGLDRERLDRFVDFVRGLLEGGKHLTRKEIHSACPPELVQGDGITVAYLFMYAELEGVLCSGPRRGKQFTYALVDERVPPSPPMTDDEALAEFVLRYLRTRGPATVPDLTMWSGLTVAQARRALDLLGGEVTEVDTGAPAYLLTDREPPSEAGVRTFLMPDFDEYGMAYKDRSAIAGPEQPFPAAPWNRVVVVDGVIVGGWKRTLAPRTVTVELDLPDIPVDDPRVVAAAEEYATFLGRDLDLRSATRR
ncbi:MAG: winged helix DNA-binding domain-containing protein [Lapillicoccus sp.]